MLFSIRKSTPRRVIRRRPAPAIGVVTVLLAVLAAAVAAAPAAADANCAKQVIADWYDNGRVDKIYPLACYREAIRILPTDVIDYSNAKEEIGRALAYAKQGQGDPGSKPAGTSTTPTATTPTTSTPTATTPQATTGSATTTSQASGLREETTTFAPWAANCCAIDRPIPREAPVTTATFPERSNKGGMKDMRALVACGRTSKR